MADTAALVVLGAQVRVRAPVEICQQHAVFGGGMTEDEGVGPVGEDMVDRAVDDYQVAVFPGVEVVRGQHGPLAQVAIPEPPDGLVDFGEKIPVVMDVDEPFPVGTDAVLSHGHPVAGQGKEEVVIGAGQVDTANIAVIEVDQPVAVGVQNAEVIEDASSRLDAPGNPSGLGR